MIKFEHVSKIYLASDGRNVGLEDATIQIDEGEFVFLVGPSGAGKSTFIKLITKEIDPDEGDIYVDGEKVTRLSHRRIPQLRRKIGIVFQNFQLLQNMTVFENVAFAMEVVHLTGRTIKRQVPTVLQMMGIEEKADRFPKQLSAGEQQRVAIARAIVNHPKMIIADEPTGNLDPDTAWEIMQLLDMINQKGTTVVVVTHDDKIVNRMGKRVVAISNGRIVKDSQEGVYGYDD
ncbi:MAG: cell division ATP-binding protein FtsE [Clostridia bacterium]|nr:cell division ATP-binding protein FtsE [Clostridia bacterium]